LFAANFDTPGNARGVTVSGDMAYVADYTTGLQVIDISDPTTPSFAGSRNTPHYAWNVAICGDSAYVGDQGSGLQVIDISNPTSPSLGGSYDTPGNAYGVTISGDYVYIAVDGSGLQVIDVSSPTSPSLGGSFDTPGNAYGVDISGDYAYVADYDSGLQVIEISDPTSPTLAGSYDTPGLARNVAVSGDHAYVADLGAGLQVIEISDPTSPSLVGNYDTPSIAYDVAISGDYAYVADYNSGLQVIDISDPTSPSLAASRNTPGATFDVAISGDYAYMADFDWGLQVIDISDPTSPSLAGSYDTPGSARGVSISGDYAYVADHNSGLQVIQVYQRMVNPSMNVGQSLAFDGLEDDILWVKLASTQIDSIRWEISADNGSSWKDVLPDGAWNLVATPGSDLLWRSTHVYIDTRPTVNPTCTSLDIEWLGEFGVIDSITDVPNDQGKQVSVKWTRSGYDYLGSPTPITEYAIYRKIDNNLSSAPGTEVSESDRIAVGCYEGNHASKLAYPPGDWHFLMTMPACCEWSYAVVVPTLADSTVAEGVYYTTFFVRALTETLGVYFDSSPDSGYSVDNLSPHVPESFAAAYNAGSGNELSWDESPDADFRYFCIYRDESGDFEPAPGNLVHLTTGTDWVDAVEEGWRYSYKITAVDFSGNESDPASAGTVTAVTEPVIPKAYALHQNVPNPFNPATTIHYDVPAGGGEVTLRVYDVSGRLVRTLADGTEGPGKKTVTWDGRNDRGRMVASGVYFYRLTSETFTKTRKMLLMK
jgi:hypothetical protein